MKSMRQIIHEWIWIILMLFCVVGLFYPAIGVIAIICMLAPSIVAFFQGRYWCGNFCPRGSFHDVILFRFSRKKQLPGYMKSRSFRIGFLIIHMSAFTVQLVLAWGSWSAVGAVFVRMILVTTAIAIFLGIFYTQRAWCAFCPMGTMAHYVTKWRGNRNAKSQIPFSSVSCVSCKLCSKSCPMEIDVLKYREVGMISDPDCIRCETCVKKCPRKALG